MATERPVPWITLWSGEWDEYVATSCQPGNVKRSEELGIEAINTFEAHGVLFRAYPNMQGDGEPMFSQVHTQRHFRAIKGPRCQVCGKKLPRERIPWLVPHVEMELQGSRRDASVLKDIPGTRPNEPLVVMSPPTCLDCQTVAKRFCPALRETQSLPMALEVDSYRIWGVAGEWFHSNTKPADQVVVSTGGCSHPLDSGPPGDRAIGPLHSRR